MKKYKFCYKGKELEFDRVDLRDAIKSHLQASAGTKSLSDVISDLCGASANEAEAMIVEILLDNGELVEYIADHCADTALAVENVRVNAQEHAIDSYEMKRDEERCCVWDEYK